MRDNAWKFRSYNLGQNKWKTQTPPPPFPPKSRMEKWRLFALRAASSLIWGEWGFAIPFYFVQDCRSSETSFPHFYANRPLLSLDNNLKRLIPIIYSVFNVLYPKCVAHENKRCVYFINFPYFHSFSCENRIGSQLAYFLKQIILFQ